VGSVEGIGGLAREGEGAVNVVMGLDGAPLTVTQLAELGVKRISTGGSLFRAAYGVVRSASRGMLDHGRFDYADGALPDRGFNALVAAARQD